MKERTIKMFFVIVLLIGIGSLVLQFVPQSAKVDQVVFDVLENHMAGIEIASQVRLDEFDTRITSIEEISVISPLNIAYINIETAFTAFTNAVEDLRQEAFEKQQDIVFLGDQFAEAAISEEQYQSIYRQLQIELLQAQVNVNIGMIAIMTTGFLDIQDDLEQLQTQSAAISVEVENLAILIRAEEIDLEELNNRYTQSSNAFMQIDKWLTMLAVSKIIETTEKVALANDYDLVIQAKNVIIYRNSARLVDITDAVKQELVKALE